MTGRRAGLRCTPVRRIRRRRTPAAAVLAAAALGVAAAGALLAPAAGAGQAAERFGDRLSRLPVDYRTTATVTGVGVVEAVLRGRELTVTAQFRGLSSPATAAHLHQAPKGRRGGVAFAIDLGGARGAAAGAVTETLTLTPAEVAELRGERYYLQIHTEGNPDGELRGWLLRTAGAAPDRGAAGPPSTPPVR